MPKNLAELAELLESINGFAGRVVYRAWNVGDAPDPPFICYLETSSDNFAADGVVYHHTKHVDVELYTDYKDVAAEAAIEAAFDAAGIYWTAYEQYIDDEKLYEKIYEIEV